MCGIIGSVSTLVVGAVLVVASSLLGYVLVPNVIKNVIVGEVTLLDDSIQLERFQDIPFALNFTVKIFNLTNPNEVLNGGVPVMTEIGPYVYRLYQTRELLGLEDDIIRYKRHEHFEFDPILSFPNTEDDMLNIVNVPFHAIIQVAERFYPNLMTLLNLAMDSVFGDINAPFVTVRVRDLLFDGIKICKNPGPLGMIACAVIREIAKDAQNIEEMEDGSLKFSIIDYKEQLPSGEYKVIRGINDHQELGRIVTYAGSKYFGQWPNYTNDYVSVCNMVEGTDAGIFAPFVDHTKSLYAINTDICRSVELRFQFETEYKGIPALRYASNEWLLDNNEGCFCLNVTSGLNREDGCLLQGAMELYTCVGAFLILSYPHFLFADTRYRDSVIGMRPDEENHKIFIDIEPNTGTPIRGAKRAQFNIFSRAIDGVPPTQKLRTALIPILWIDEAINLPDEFVDELTGRLLFPLRLVDIFVPVIIAFCSVVLLIGISLSIRAKCRKVVN